MGTNLRRPSGHDLQLTTIHLTDGTGRTLTDELREKHFHNRVFDSIDTLEDHLVIALRQLEHAPDRVQSITAWDWIINAVSIAK